MNRPEIFAEIVGSVRHFDGPLYFATGAETYTQSVQRGLYRLRYDARENAVRYEFCASFHARIALREVCEDGREIVVIAGRGVSGRSFWFRVPLVWLTSGKSSDGKRFLRAFCGARGTLPSFVYPGKLQATLRAIVALSGLGEPIPLDAGTLARLDG